MRVQITQELIDQAIPGDKNGNPVALAMANAGFTDTWCDRHEYGGTGLDNQPQKMRLPSYMIAWMENYENGKPVIPVFFLCPATIEGKPEYRRGHVTSSYFNSPIGN